MKYKKIAFIGMMGSGKTTISNLLANKFGYQVVEMDAVFEQNENVQIKDYFRIFGEKSFRQKEKEILKSVSKMENIIISTGGGVVLDEANRDILFNSDIYTIYLKADSDEIFKRLKNDTNRPLLLVDNPKEKIKGIIDCREKYYNLAHVEIDVKNKTVQKVLEEVEEKLWKKY